MILQLLFYTSKRTKTYKITTIPLPFFSVLCTSFPPASSEWQHSARPDSDVESPAFQRLDHTHPAQPSGAQDPGHHRHEERGGPGDCRQPGHWYSHYLLETFEAKGSVNTQQRKLWSSRKYMLVFCFLFFFLPTMKKGFTDFCALRLAVSEAELGRCRTERHWVVVLVDIECVSPFFFLILRKSLC